MPSGCHAAPPLRRLWFSGFALAAFMLPALASPDALARAGLGLRETVAGVLAYTRWPVTPDPLRLCFVGDSLHADRLQRQGIALSGRPPVLLLHPEPDQPLAAQCDAVYIGALDAAEWPALTQSLAAQPVLTLCERSTPCVAGGMVRLDIDATGEHVRFEINLDAVTRGGVRIHPQVLRLGRRGPEQEHKP